MVVEIKKKNIERLFLMGQEIVVLIFLIELFLVLICGST
jgi:hypothetical protein